MAQKEQKKIPMTPVKSSNLKGCGHCKDSSTLVVEFNHGGVYHFAGVDEETADAFLSAESVGKAFHSMIKGKFESTKI
jgi:hypothetical protein